MFYTPAFLSPLADYLSAPLTTVPVFSLLCHWDMPEMYLCTVCRKMAIRLWSIQIAFLFLSKPCQSLFLTAYNSVVLTKLVCINKWREDEKNLPGELSLFIEYQKHGYLKAVPSPWDEMVAKILQLPLRQHKSEIIGAFVCQALLDTVSFLLMPAQGSWGMPIRLSVALWNKEEWAVA